MTKKDYELIASVIIRYKDSLYTKEQHMDIACDFADKLAEKNTKFDRAKFLKACGVEIVKCEHSLLHYGICTDCGHNTNK